MHYEEMLAGSTLKLGDEYLPELFDAAHHRPATDGLAEFRDLFLALPSLEHDNLELAPKIKALIFAEVEKHSSFLNNHQDSKCCQSADARMLFRILRMLPRPMQKRLVELITTLGCKNTGADLWNYLVVTSNEFERS
jgi:hypothetical protein